MTQDDSCSKSRIIYNRPSCLESPLEAGFLGGIELKTLPPAPKFISPPSAATIDLSNSPISDKAKGKGSTGPFPGQAGPSAPEQAQLTELTLSSLSHAFDLPAPFFQSDIVASVVAEI